MKTVTYFSLAILLPTAVEAQIFNCGGRWTNIPCAGGQEVRLGGPKRTVMAPEEAAAMSKKRSLLHELTMKNIQAARDFDVRFDISVAEDTCLDRASSLDDCRQIVANLDDRLDERLNRAALLREQQRANELQEEANREKSEQSVVAVTTNEENIYIVNPQQRYPHDGRYRHPSGVSIGIQGTSGNIDYSGQVGYRSHSASSDVRLREEVHVGKSAPSTPTPYKGGARAMAKGQ